MVWTIILFCFCVGTFLRWHVLTFLRWHVLTLARSHVGTLAHSHVGTLAHSHVGTFPRCGGNDGIDHQCYRWVAPCAMSCQVPQRHTTPPLPYNANAMIVGTPRVGSRNAAQCPPLFCIAAMLRNARVARIAHHAEPCDHCSHCPATPISAIVASLFCNGWQCGHPPEVPRRSLFRNAGIAGIVPHCRNARIATQCPPLFCIARIAPQRTVMAIIAIVARQCMTMWAPTRGAPTILP